MARPVILTIFGTRPEAIKMAPVVHTLRAHAGFDTCVAVTGQHRWLLDQALGLLDIRPDIDLDAMRPGQPLTALAARMVKRIGATLDKVRADRVLVHGDTLTTTAATLAAYLKRVPVGHVEAGLRSGDLGSPWPEEGNRRIAAAVTDLHFAPTERAAANLRAEHIPATAIHVTGNTVVDALLNMRARLIERPALARGLLPLARRFAGLRTIAVTVHRRENHGERLAGIAKALMRIAARSDVALVVPVHPNPAVRPELERMLGHHDRIALIEPLDYSDFVRLMDMAYLILTDSGGVQEEAPTLGTPVLVLRERTERPEAIAAGAARLIGAEPDRIVSETASLLDDDTLHRRMASAGNPFGDGHAAARIAAILARRHL